MKKLIIMILALMLFLTGCISIETADDASLQAEYDALKTKYDLLAKEYAELTGDTSYIEIPTESKPVPAGKFDSDTVLSQLDVTEYTFSSDFWEYAFLTIKNNSEFDIKISVEIKFYNAGGELVGANSAEEHAFEHGTEILFYFMPDEKFEKMEYEFTVYEEDWYECVVSDLTYESVPAKNKEIVSVTNNSSETAKFVEGSALFFKGEKVVYFDQNYFTDDDSELKPGKTITRELNAFEKYDSVKFFFTGRR